ncbi:MAG: helix-hairpin-helix domain-containing protein [Acidobacteria bacterium]|nr:MAG: helix-hairpin-helix domain-containing protein [Acidobacteriota bacterium]
MFRGSSVLVLVLGVVLAGPVFAPAIVSAQQAAAPAAAKGAAAAPVNLNTATAEQLDGLPGVGQAMAARILEYRQKNGGFKKIEELMNIKGIGEKNFLKLKPLVTVTPAKTTPAGDQAR